MDTGGKVIVVTGGASGIGRAMARRFHAEGAAGVVVADRDAAGVAAVAAELDAIRPASALGVVADMAVEADVVALVDRAEEAFGPVELFCANAGILVGAGLETSDDDWQRTFGVNFYAHLYAARTLVPRWLERGGGYLLVTASAAGLLTQVGAAPYTVSKHAAVAFAEWLAVTYGDQGVKVSCLCPQAVHTALTAQGASPDLAVGVDVVKAAGATLEPEDVAEAVVAGLASERFLILPHPEVHTFVERKANDVDRWLAGMRRFQARIAAG